MLQIINLLTNLHSLLNDLSDDLFYHKYPFALSDIFPDKISKSQLLVRFEVVKIFSSVTIEKKILCKKFY